MATATRPAPGRLGTRLGAILAPAVGTLLLDAATKSWAEQALAMGRPVPVLGDVFRLTLSYNSGVAFGMWQDAGGPLLLLTGAIITVLGVWLVATLGMDRLPVQRWPLALMFGGALSNFLDRLPDGRVTDLLDVGIGARWPTFNLADTSIVLGVGALAAYSFLGGREQRDTL